MNDTGMNAVEQQIRAAQARGDFDDLPGAGKPLDLGNADDPEWWVKRLVEREQLDMTGALPSALQLRKEADSYPESLADVSREADVREILEDFNRRVRRDRLQAFVGNGPQIIAPTVDVEDMLTRWVELRRSRSERAPVRGGTPGPDGISGSSYRFGVSRTATRPEAHAGARPRGLRAMARRAWRSLVP